MENTAESKQRKNPLVRPNRPETDMQLTGVTAYGVDLAVMLSTLLQRHGYIQKSPANLAELLQAGDDALSGAAEPGASSIQSGESMDERQEQLESPSKPRPPSLGTSVDAIMRAFRGADLTYQGQFCTRAKIIGSSLEFCWQSNGKLGVVVNTVCVRDATSAECDELEEALELGQVQIVLQTLCFTPRLVEVLHQATGTPLDTTSRAARAQQARWDRAYPKESLAHFE